MHHWSRPLAAPPTGFIGIFAPVSDQDLNAVQQIEASEFCCCGLCPGSAPCTLSTLSAPPPAEVHTCTASVIKPHLASCAHHRTVWPINFHSDVQSLPEGLCVVVSEKESSYSIKSFHYLQSSTSLLSPNPSSLVLVFLCKPCIIMNNFDIFFFYLNLTMNCAPKLIPTKTDSGNCWATPLMFVFPYLFPQLWHTESKDPPVCLYGLEFNS